MNDVEVAPRTGLRWRIVVALLVVSLLPLAVMGLGAWIVFGRLLEEKAMQLQATVVRTHARSIESHLAESIRQLELVAATHDRDEITAVGALESVFNALERASGGGFVDLGVVSDEGDHLAYVGPFDLVGLSYREADWFREVMAKGVFVSDVFLGFRQVPHIIVAVRASEARPWILRATLSSEHFAAIVEGVDLGPSSAAFLVNREGIYQTAPPEGMVLTQAHLSMPEPFDGVRAERAREGRRDRIRTISWINDGRWLLVVQQDAREVRQPVVRAIAKGGIVSFVSVILVVLTTILATRHLSNQIDRANAQREEMFRAFMRSAKLASVGELATGLAHEINNPLAIISAEHTNLSDMLPELEGRAAVQAEINESLARIKRQIERCSNITTKMLQFGRQRESAVEPTELGPRLSGIVALMRRQASVRNISIRLEIAPVLPPVTVDPIELEQIVVNLMNNAFSALPGGGQIVVRAQHLGPEVHITVEDNGQGMSPEIKERIFEPFFTTKPVGQGTGLGLSVCYGIVQSWGGHIEVDSEPGEGTAMTIHLPIEVIPQDKESNDG